MKIKHDCYEATVNFEDLTARDVVLILDSLQFTGALTRGAEGDYKKLYQEIDEKIQSLGTIGGN